MIGLTVMDISAEQMQAIVQWYLNNNLLNVTFQNHHESVVEDVRQRSNGRFVIEFRAAKKAAVTTVKPTTTDTVSTTVGTGD